MVPNTRRFLLGAVVVVAAGLCTGLVAYYGGVRSTAAAQATSEFTYIPADAAAVAFADVRRIMDSEFRQRLRAAMPTGDEKDRFFEETGIDIERDIDVVVAGLMAGPDSAVPGKPDGVVLLRGRFDQARIEAAAVEHGAQQEQYGGRAMLVLPDAHATMAPSAPGMAVPVEAPSLAFLEAGLLAVGSADDLRRAIDIAASGNGIAANTEMMRVIASVQGTGDAWFVAEASQMTNQAGMPDQVRGQLDGIEWLSAVADIDSSVRTFVRAEARDEMSAKNLRDVLNGALAAARMFVGDDPRAAAALASVQTSGTGLNVELSFEIPSTIFEMIPPGAAEAASLRSTTP